MTKGNRIWKEARRTTITSSVAACAIAVSIAAVAGVSGTNGVEPAAAEAISAPNVLQPRGGLAWRDYFPNMELTTHNGDRVRFYDDLIKDKVVVINFMYTKCTAS
jgi:cytochrome oxidase Cu insertion factor (SCO1/SenC/PrrC family)